jgi:tetratricopeptide (TPR) repeat protein
MSIIDRILGRAPVGGPKLPARTGSLPPITVMPAPPSQDGLSSPATERPISVYDQHGRKIEVGREAWRRDVLLPHLAANRDDPDALHGLIRDALRDDFALDVLEYARQLADTDPQPRRGALLLGAVLLQLRDFDGARAVFERAIARHGEDPYLLASLARSLAELGDEDRAEELIWRALALDPNDEAALEWVAARAGATGGQPALLAIYARAAMLPGSWRAHLALAAAALARGDVDEAARLYEEALARVAPPPTSLLMRMSEELADRGQHELLVRLVEPRFNLAAHGLIVGNNLLHAHFELGRLVEAGRLIERLQAERRPEWGDSLLAWQHKLDDARRRCGSVAAPAELIFLRLEQPVWSGGQFGFEAVLPRKAESAPRIVIVCASGECPPASAGELGRISRALPMFLAEELYLCTRARCVFVLPWMKRGGFVLSPQRWTRASLPDDPAPPQLIVFTHVDATRTPWNAQLTLEQPRRAEAPAISIRQNIDPVNVAQGVVALLETLMMRVSMLLAVQRLEADPALAAPDSGRLAAYLDALEQALAVWIAVSQEVGDSFLGPERAIFDQLFDVCEKGARMLRPRMLYLTALENRARLRPDLVGEYLDKLLPLEERYPTAHACGARLLASAEEGIAGLVRPG